VALATGGALEIVGDLVLQDCGFNLHAKTRADAVDDEARATVDFTASLTTQVAGNGVASARSAMPVTHFRILSILWGHGRAAAGNCLRNCYACKSLCICLAMVNSPSKKPTSVLPQANTGSIRVLAVGS
jgi:hypothetical protein